MPTMHVNGTELYVSDTGAPVSGPGQTPVLFLHGFLFDGRMFDPQVEALRERYRCLTVDFRGQGRSGRPRHGYQMENHYADVLAVLRGLELRRVHVVGLSMGGFTGMRLAARHPDLVASLTLLNTSAGRHPLADVPRQGALGALARVLGMRPLLGQAEKALYGRAFRENPGTADAREVWRSRWLASDPASLAHTLYGFMLRPSVEEEIRSIDIPTLVMVAEEDVSTRPEESEAILRLIPGAESLRLPGVGHTATLEAPDNVTHRLRGFLADAGRYGTTADRLRGAPAQRSP